MPAWEQMEFDDRVVNDRHAQLMRAQEALDEKHRVQQESSRRIASQVMADDVLSARQPQGRKPTTMGKPNRYPGKCADCAKQVAEGQGRAIKWNGKWAVFCGCKGYPLPDAKANTPKENKGPKFEDNPWFQDLMNKGESYKATLATFMGYDREMVTLPKTCPGCGQETSYFRPLVGSYWCAGCNTGLRGDGSAIQSNSPLHLAQP